MWWPRSYRATLKALNWSGSSREKARSSASSAALGLPPPLLGAGAPPLMLQKRCAMLLCCGAGSREKMAVLEGLHAYALLPPVLARRRRGAQHLTHRVVLLGRRVVPAAGRHVFQNAQGALSHKLGQEVRHEGNAAALLDEAQDVISRHPLANFGMRV